MEKVRLFHKNDIILVLVLLLLAVAGLFVFKFFYSGEGKKVKVTIDGVLFGEYLLGSKSGSVNTDDEGIEFDAVAGGDGYVDLNKQDLSNDVNVSEASGINTSQAGDGQIIKLPGIVGECILVIKDGQAYMQEADCPNQICVHHSAISHKGETIVCLPNRIIIEVL